MQGKYNFDEIIDRRGTHCVKYDGLKRVFNNENLQALWVADMDFATPDFIIDAIRTRLGHPVLGYQEKRKDYFSCVAEWLDYLYGWKVAEEELRYIPGIVKGIGHALQAFTVPSDKVIIQTPVYHPFRLVPQHNGREVVYNPLILTDKGYEMDFDGLEALIAEGGCKMLILANPHNPAGILWPRETLVRLADICHRNGIIVISDEIHSEMAHNDVVHTPFASVSDKAAACSVTFMAPSKTFNIAGVVSSYTVVKDPSLRDKFFSYLDASEFAEPNIFSVEATIAAYTYGKEWRRQMLSYVWDNILFVEQAAKKIPGITIMKPGASFLIWMDCRGLLERLCGKGNALDQSVLEDFFINKAGLALNSGMVFSSDGGNEGLGFMRLNVGAPRSILADAFDRIARCCNL